MHITCATSVHKVYSVITLLSYMGEAPEKLAWWAEPVRVVLSVFSRSFCLRVYENSSRWRTRVNVIIVCASCRVGSVVSRYISRTTNCYSWRRNLWRWMNLYRILVYRTMYFTARNMSSVCSTRSTLICTMYILQYMPVTLCTYVLLSCVHGL